MLEAPAGVGGARAGRASIICGGDAELFARIKPLFECFATTIPHVGPVGNASISRSTSSSPARISPSPARVFTSAPGRASTRIRVTRELTAKTVTPMPFGSLLHEQFVAAMGKGWGAEDWACEMKVMELATGTEVKRASSKQSVERSP